MAREPQRVERDGGQGGTQEAVEKSRGDARGVGGTTEEKQGEEVHRRRGAQERRVITLRALAAAEGAEKERVSNRHHPSRLRG